MQINVFSGLAGCFGGPSYIKTMEVEHPSEALFYAYKYALKLYNLFEDHPSLLSLEDCINILREKGVDERIIREEAVNLYHEEIEKWIRCYYYIVPEDEKEVVDSI